MKKKNESHRNQRIMARFLISILLGLMVSFPVLPTTTVQAEDAAVVALSATYTGEPVLVGKEIDTSKLQVTATYVNGMINEITDYTIVSKTITTEGSNMLMVIYQGKTASFYVVGKRIISLYAYYTGGLVSIGNSVGKKDVKVRAEFSNDSNGLLTDFELHNNEITTIGQNEVYVTCEGQVLKISVWGVAPKEILSLYATYTGGTVTVGNSVNRSDLTITAAYKDGSSEEIHNYVLTPEVVGATGTQMITAYYQGKTVSFQVVGAYNEITAITAKYIGNPVGVGYSVQPNDVIVTATYSDGSTGVVKQFNLLSANISYVGYQIVTAEAGGYKAEFIVQGVADQIIDFSNANVFAITNGTNTGKVSISIPKSADKTSILGMSIDNSSVARILTRAVKNSTYISFTVEENDDEIMDQFPLTMKIELPKEFTLADTSLYFTPNRKSVLGKMNVQNLAPNLIIVEIHNPGTYIVSYKK